MVFLNKQYQDYLNKLFEPKRSGKKFLIPIGIQKLCISKVKSGKSAAGNPMIILSIEKYELISEYSSINNYYVANYDNLKACDKRGIPYGIKGLEFFMMNIHSYEIVHYPNDHINWIIGQIKDFVNKPFLALISHSTRLFYKAGELVIKEGANTPIVLHKAEMVEYGLIGSEIRFDGKYPSLINGLASEEKLIYDEYIRKEKQRVQTNINSIL